MRRSKKSRSLAAKRGWAARRRREAAEFRRRSKAAKKGWRKRKRREKIRKEAKAKPKATRGALREWLVSWKYTSGKPTKANRGSLERQVDFLVIARKKEDAELFVTKAAAKGEDSVGSDLTWLADIPWNEVITMSMEEANEEAHEQAEIAALGNGYVEIR